MKSFLTKPLLYTSVLSGVALSLLLVLIPHTVKSFPAWTDVALLFSIQLVATLAIGFLAGFVLRNKIASSYVVSIAAMLYLYDVATLLVFARGFGHIIFTLLLALVSVYLFNVSGKLFDKYSENKKRFFLFSVGGSIILWTLCAPLGLFMTRLITSILVR